MVMLRKTVVALLALRPFGLVSPTNAVGSWRRGGGGRATGGAWAAVALAAAGGGFHSGGWRRAAGSMVASSEGGVPCGGNGWRIPWAVVSTEVDFVVVKFHRALGFHDRDFGDVSASGFYP